MTLTQRIEAAEAPSAELFREAWEKSQPVSRDPDRFLALIEDEAWLDAAVLFLPDGWDFTVRATRRERFASVSSQDFKSVTWGRGENWITDVLSGTDAKAKARHPALALLAACLKARGIE